MLSFLKQETTKTMKTILNTLMAIIAIVTLSFGAHVEFGIPIAPTAMALTAVSFLVPTQTGIAMTGLNKEVWFDAIFEGFWSEDTWMGELRNFDVFVENDIIHIAEAGIAPEVFINNTAWPIPVVERADSHGELILDNYDTENTRVRDVDQIELAYNKLESVVYGHKQSLKTKFMEKGAYAIAPATDSTYTPKISTTGEVDGTRKRMSFNDIEDLGNRFDEAEMSPEGRILVITPTHKKDLQKEDRKLYREVMAAGEVFGFKIYVLAGKRMPHYHITTGAKLALGATVTTGYRPASFVFLKDEAFRCKGSETMYNSKAENDPFHRANTIGFHVRGLVGSIRNKGVGVIYDAAA